MTHDFRAIGKKLSNWGRWGKDDERGTTNLITPERIAAGAKLAKTGKVFGQQLTKNVPTQLNPGDADPNPLIGHAQ